jgi:hypothetical protein
MGQCPPIHQHGLEGILLPAADDDPKFCSFVQTFFKLDGSKKYVLAACSKELQLEDKEQLDSLVIVIGFLAVNMVIIWCSHLEESAFS